MKKTRYHVNIWEKRKRSGRRSPWEVRWIVGEKEFSRSFRTSTLAEGFRGDLVKATKDLSETFSLVTGVPESWEREQVSVYALARELAKRRWDESRAGCRQSLAHALTVCVLAALDPRKARHDAPDAKLARKALRECAFNPSQWGSEPEEFKPVLDWMAAASLPVSALEDSEECLDRVLKGIRTRLDGKAYAAWSYRSYRGALYSLLTLAKTKRAIAANPLDSREPEWVKTTHSISPLQVPNLSQARRVLAAVPRTRGRGKRLYAFFATIYYAGCRPGEVIGLTSGNLTLPAHGWGEITLSASNPDLGGRAFLFTDDGTRHGKNGLKSRADNEVRIVPIPPDLVRILRDHMKEFPPAPDGRVFYLEDTAKEKAPRITGEIYRRVWRRARKMALTDAEFASKLAARPYDLRHGNASLLLSLRIAPTEVARRLGHSVEMLYKVYAHWLTDMIDHANALIEKALRAPEKGQVKGKTGHGPTTGQVPDSQAA